MTKAGDVNRAMVNRVAKCLGPLRQKVNRDGSIFLLFHLSSAYPLALLKIS
jgi:hypothetical protein